MSDSIHHTVTYHGGSEEDRAEVMRLFDTFWTANNTLDIPALEPYWGDVVFFNSNGAVYHGVEEWQQVWRYYGARFSMTTPATLSATTVFISGDLAVVCDEGVLRGWKAIDVDTVSAGIAEDQRIRTTLVLERNGSSWTIQHLHFSPRGTGPRPAFADESNELQ
jgi:ketosteroid isomerase-like protein